MKKFIMAIGMAALLSAGNAFADDSNSTAGTFGGSVVPTCVLNPITFTSGSGAALSGTPTSSAATVALSGLADPATAKYQTGVGVTLGYSGYCNYQHTVRVQTLTGNLKNVTATNNPVAGSLPFIQSLNYTVLATWDGAVVTLTADGTPLKKSVNGAVSGANRGNGTIYVTIADPVDDTVPMQAGVYTDVLKLQIGAPL